MMCGTRLAAAFWLLVSAVAVFAALLLPSAASAAGTPNIALSKSTDSTVLFGQSSNVTLTASDPAGQPTGYNLSFRDVLPAGISYVANSAPAKVGEPEIINNAPSAGQTTLIWSNVSDLTANSSFSFTYKVNHAQASHPVGDIFTDNAGAYINCDPRYVPDFSATGVPTQSGGNATCTGTPAESSYTGSATASAATKVTAIKLDKSEPSPEGELLRGLHDQQTVYTLKVTNNDVNPTKALGLEDYLPAGLEFLGCGGADNTTNAPTNPGSKQEYPGSGPINPGNEPGGAAPAGCVAPSKVETVSNPPGLAAGVYTHVVWSNLTDLAPGQVFTLRYIAAIPIRANTLDWNGATAGNGTAPATTGLQASNLDNNSGAETNEDNNTEPSNKNTATASGTYTPPVGASSSVSDSKSYTVTSEDLRILKKVDSDELSPGGLSKWTLKADTGEYRFVTDAVVTDTLGDGYCPLAANGNLEHTPPAASAECNAVSGRGPSVPYTSSVESTNGSWTLTWDKSTDPALARLEPNSSHTISFSSKTRKYFQENYADAGPILARDTAGNDVAVAGPDWVVCAPGNASPVTPGTCDAGDAKIDHAETDGTIDRDVSSAGQEAPGASIDKKVDSVAGRADCLDGNYVDSPAPTARPGDTVCYRLRMDFPGTPQTGFVRVTDFLPPGTSFVAGSAQVTSNNTVAITTPTPPQPIVNGRQLTWTVDDGANSVQAGRVFEVVIKASVGRLPNNTDGDLLDNLQKAVFKNTAGTSFPLRDSAGFGLSQPELTLAKGVRQVNSGTIRNPAVDGLTVAPNDDVTYAIDLSNSGSLAASNTSVWDVLPSKITCATVGTISDGGTCNAATGRVEWTTVGVPAYTTVNNVKVPGTKQLTYHVTVPSGLAPNETLTNTAGIRKYESASSTGPFTSIPSSNIDTTLETSANTDPAKDTSNIKITDASITKTRTTEINSTAAGNDNTQATIGEEIYYQVQATIPAGTTVQGATTALVDNVDPRLQILGTPKATLDTDGTGGAAPVALPTGGMTLNVSGNSLSVNLPNPYANALGSGNDIITLTFTARPTDAYPANYSQGTALQKSIPNSSSFTFSNSSGTPRTVSASAATTVVEPKVSISKSSNGAAVINPGDDVTFTLNASNASGTGVSSAYDGVVVDKVPAGFTPVNGSTPVADGGTVNPDGGIWSSANRTITWSIVKLDPGQSKSLSYHVVVDQGATGAGKLTNTASYDVTSLPDVSDDDGGERTPSSAGSPPGYHAGASHDSILVSGSITKSSTPANATIGRQVSQKLTVTIPPFIQDYDSVVVDTLPDGLDFDSYGTATCTAGCSGGGTNINPTSLGAQANTSNGTTKIGWSLGDLQPASVPRTVELNYTTHVDDTYSSSSAVVDGNTLVNNATFAFNTTDKVTTPPTTPPDPTTFDQQRTGSATTTVIEPKLTIDKDVSGDPDDDDVRGAQPGDSFTYTLAVKNTGDAPAFDVTVTDKPDAKLTNVQLGTGASLITDGWSAADPSMKWKIPGPIAPGATVTLTYTADLVPSAQLSNGDQVVNTADVPSYFGISSADRAANPTYDYNNYDNVTADTVTVNLQLPAVDINKTTGATGNPDNAPAKIQTAFPWHLVITNPNSPSELDGVDVADTLPKNWDYVAGSAQITGTGSLTPGGQVDPAIAGQKLTWSNLGDLDGDETIVIDFDAKPKAAAAVDPGVGTQTNSATATGEDVSGATANADGDYTDTDTATASLASPSVNLRISKTADDASPIAGTDTSWTLGVDNDGPETAPSVSVTDTLPSGLTFVSATPDQGTCSYDGPSRVVTCAIGEMAKNAHVEIDLVTKVGQADDTIQNTAKVADPTVTETDTTDNEDSDTVTPQIGGRLVKESSPAKATIGDQLTQKLTVTIPAHLNPFDTVVVDTLPDGLDFDSYLSAQCTAGCGATGDEINPTSLSTTENADGTTQIGWLLGDLTAANIDRTVVFTYNTHVDDAYVDSTAVGDGDTLLNSANLAFNRTDKVSTDPTAPPDSDDFDRHPGDDATTDVIEPQLTIDKDVSGDPGDDDVRGARPGDGFIYSLAIENTGDSPAYDVSVTDQPDAKLTNVQLADGASFSTDGWSASDPKMKWLIPGPIAPGDTVTLTYTADLVDSSQLSDGDQVANTADVPSYFGVSSADRSAQPGFDYNDYDNVEDDTVTIDLQLPSVTIDKTTGAQGNPDDAPASIDTAFPWHLVITNPNDPSVLNGVDVLDTLPKNWDYVAGSAQITGTGSLTPGGQVDPAIAGQKLTWSNLGDLDGDETIVIDFEATPEAKAAISPGVGVAHTNTATATGEDSSGANGNADGDYSDTDDATATLDAPSVNLTMTKSADDPTPVAGTNASWTLTAHNEGPQTSPSVKVTDVLPDGLTYVSADPDQGSCDFDQSTVTLTCNLGEMKSGAAVEIALVTKVGARFGGQQITNLSTVADATVEETSDTDNEGSDTITAVPSADLELHKKLLGKLQVGKPATYRLDVTNNGFSLAHDVSIVDRLPSQLRYVRANTRGCSADGQRVECELGDLDPGQKVSVKLTVKVVGYSKKGIRNSAKVTSPDPDPNPKNDTDSVTSHVGATDLAIEKTGPKNLVAGHKGEYRLRVRNVGKLPSGGVVTLTDHVPSQLKLRSAKGKGWDCSKKGQTAKCKRSDSLAPGKSFPVVHIGVSVPRNARKGEVHNVAKVTMPGDTKLSNNHDGVKTPIGSAQDIADISVSNSCTDGRLLVQPSKVLIGGPSQIFAFLRDKHGKPVGGISVELVHRPGGQVQKAKTNGQGRATFRVEASSETESWTAQVKPCHLHDTVKAEPQPGCARQSDTGPGEQGRDEPAPRC